MTKGKPVCPTCGGETHREGMHCAACMETYMATMTPEDWQSALSEVLGNVISVDGEQGKT